MAATAPVLSGHRGSRDAASDHLWLPVAAGLIAFAGACGFALAVGELDAFYVTISLATCIAVMFDFRIGAVLLILLLPISSTTLFPRGLMGITGLNPANVLLAATVLSYLVRGRAQGAPPFVPRQMLWLYIVPIVVGGLIGAPHATEILPELFDEGAATLHFTGPGGYLRDMLIKPLLIPVTALAIGAALARSQKPERFIVPIALSVWVIALVQVGYVLISGVRLGELAASSARGFFDAIGMHANDLGRLYAVAYALLLFCWWETKRPALKLFLFLTMGLLGFALLLTFSRAAFLGALLISALFVLWKFNAKTVSLALLGGVTVVMLAPGYLVGRVMVGFDGGAGGMDEVSAGRVEGIWLPLLPELWHSPVWGNGLGSIMWSSALETGAVFAVNHPHNAYLEALLDMGLVGLVLLLAYYWHVWKGFRALASNAYLSPEMRGLFQGATAGLICFAVTGMAGSSLRPDSEFAFLWVAIGMMYGMLARRPTS